MQHGNGQLTSASGRFVAPMTVTPISSSTPSISFSRLSSTPSCVPPSTAAGEREEAKASISSCALICIRSKAKREKRTKKIMDGDALRALRKISLTARSDSPTYLFNNYGRKIRDFPNETATGNHVNFRDSTVIKTAKICSPPDHERLQNSRHSRLRSHVPAPSCCTRAAHTATRPLARVHRDARASRGARGATRHTRASG